MSPHKTHSRLLIDESSLQVLPTLAEAVGINEAIFLQQTQYWLRIAEQTEDPRKFKDGRWWTYNSYAQWQKQMPWIKERTIRAIVAKLENRGLLLSKRFNDYHRDQTKWYSIDYNALDKLLEPEVAENDTLNQDSNVSENDTSTRQKMTPVEVAENDTCNTKTTTETTTENKNPLSSKASPDEDVGGLREHLEEKRGRSSRGIKGLTEAEAEELIDQALDGRPFLDEQIQRLLQLAASKNKSNTLKLTRAWNEFVEPLTQALAKEPMSEPALRYGIQAAVSGQAPNINYALKAARGEQERMDNEPPGSVTSLKGRRQGPTPAQSVGAITWEEYGDMSIRENDKGF